MTISASPTYACSSGNFKLKVKIESTIINRSTDYPRNAIIQIIANKLIQIQSMNTIDSDKCFKNDNTIILDFIFENLQVIKFQA
jgi:hypothetical protein